LAANRRSLFADFLQRVKRGCLLPPSFKDFSAPTAAIAHGDAASTSSILSS